jgi:hypothetical protein
MVQVLQSKEDFDKAASLSQLSTHWRTQLISQLKSTSRVVTIHFCTEVNGNNKEIAAAFDSCIAETGAIGYRMNPQVAGVSRIPRSDHH